jgi:hypothetical protein
MSSDNPPPSPREFIGTVTIDSGNLTIIDPSYLEELGLPEGAYLDLAVGTARHVPGDTIPEVDIQRRYTHVMLGLGLSLLPGHGDGRYNAFVTRTADGHIAGLQIDFLD